MPGYANPQNLNRYSYVINNPLRYTDPTGHMQSEDPYESSNGTCKLGDTSCNWVGKSKEKPKKKNKGRGGNQGIGDGPIIGPSQVLDPVSNTDPTLSPLDEIVQIVKNGTDFPCFSGYAEIYKKEMPGLIGGIYKGNWAIISGVVTIIVFGCLGALLLAYGISTLLR